MDKKMNWKRVIKSIILILSIPGATMYKFANTISGNNASPFFETDIKDKKCKHDWHKMTTKVRSGRRAIEHDYLFCPKCKSVSGDAIYA